MNRDEIILMAQKAHLVMYDYDHPSLERFAALVAAHTLSNIDPSSFTSWQEGYEAGQFAEREACAKVAEAYEPRCDTCPSGVANAIRARGQA
jgi:hypothetical protein